MSIKDIPEYKVWSGMKRRCYNKNDKRYENYGGRGIIICSAWLASFWFFLQDMGSRPSELHSIDRIDNDGNYEPNNCRWSTNKEQCNNRTSCIIIEYYGREQTLTQWCEELDLNYKTIRRRIIDFNWDVDRAFTEDTKWVYEFNGEKLTLREWSVKLNIPHSTLESRIHNLKWPLDKVFSIK